ncbi:MAG: LLM class flavin-dependent oxidoreductase [Alphaproteobacteria bacterium]|nr:LLM class flavin-dependent oxidoreductase [Alphaproteobacteria bacterium]
MQRQLHLNLFINSRGHHEASWRHPDATPYALTDIRYFQDMAQRAEAALFDSVFLADILALVEGVEHGPHIWLEPMTMLGALAVSTSKIGLVATCSSTYTEPYNLARQFASLDHMSKGRVAWNIVTSSLASSARNFGGGPQISHDDRYARGEEFMKVVTALWDSWAEDAIVDDRTSGVYAHADRIRPINHRGDFYQVAGPLNVPRCPQGRPVLIQAGSSATGRSFAARHAEAIFTAQLSKLDAQEFYADIKTQTAAAGRRPDQVLILPGLSPMIAGTETEARRLAHEVDDLTDAETGRKRLSGWLGGYDLSHVPLDRPLRPGDLPHPDTVQAARSRAEIIATLASRENATLRDVIAYFAAARGHYTMAGTPEQIANLIEDWFTDGAADGFNLMPPLLPTMLDAFSAEVIPLLQRRGLFRTAYEGGMLRDHYGLNQPPSNW